jgi:hypothetical protein
VQRAVNRETKEEAQARVSAKDVGCSEVLPQTSRKILQSQGVFCLLVARSCELEALLRIYDLVETRKPKDRCHNL